MNREETIQQLEGKLQDNPKSLLFARLADLYLQENRIDDAISLCNEGVKTHPSYVTGNYLLARAYLAKGDKEQAEVELKKVLSHDQQYLSAQKELGDLMAKTGWENKAIMHYKEILRIDPMDEVTRNLLAKLTSHTGIDIKPPITDTVSIDQDEAPAVLPETSEDAQKSDTKQWEEDFENIFDEESVTAVKGDIDIPETLPPDDVPEISEGIDDSVVQADTESLSEPEEENEGGGEDEPSLQDDALSIGTSLDASDETKQEDVELDLPAFDEPVETDFNYDIKEADISLSLEEDLPPVSLTDDTEGDSEDSRSLLFEGESIPDLPVTETTDEEASQPLIKDEDEELNIPSFEKSDTDEIENAAPLVIDEPETSDELDLDIPAESANLNNLELEADEAPALNIEPDQPVDENPSDSEKDASSKKIVSPTLGEIYAAQGQYAKAIRVYESLLKDNPDEESRYLDKIAELKQKLDESNSS